MCVFELFDFRHVHDWTDHVWAEVWSETESRWLHVDPGEAIGAEKWITCYGKLSNEDDPSF
jgi:hypothetical protein